MEGVISIAGDIFVVGTETISAVLNMPQRQDKAAMCHFKDTITYLSKFCPHLSILVHPLPDLTQLNQELLWADQHTETFMKAKELLSRHFDIKVPVILQVDASDYGLNEALFQQASYLCDFTNVSRQPIAHRSGSPSATEQCYMQIEKETLAIVQAFYKFDQLLLGKSDVVVPSNHKPLETIFKLQPDAPSKARCLLFSTTLSMLSITRE